VILPSPLRRNDLLAENLRGFGDGFEIWTVGDLVNRGPDNLRVLTRMRDLVEGGRGRAVLGNHEIGLFRVHAGLRELKRGNTYSDVLTSSHCDDWIEWLRHRPLAATGCFPAANGEPGAAPPGSSPHRYAMVHASVHPDWGIAELERRARSAEARLTDPDSSAWRAFLDASDDPDFDTLSRLISCRSVMKAGQFADGRSWSSRSPEPGEESESVAWHRAWSARRHDYGIVYGHWAQQGLHIEENLRGLDTGCVHHGRGRVGVLTAWLPEPNANAPFGTPDGHLWQIPARRAYYAERLSE